MQQDTHLAADGNVRRPPPLQSLLRLQRTVGNRAAQRVMGIGDGCVEPPPPAAPGEPSPALLRPARIAIGAGTILSGAVGLAAGAVAAANAGEAWRLVALAGGGVAGLLFGAAASTLAARAYFRGKQGRDRDAPRSLDREI